MGRRQWADCAIDPALLGHRPPASDNLCFYPTGKHPFTGPAKNYIIHDYQPVDVEIVATDAE